MDFFIGMDVGGTAARLKIVDSRGGCLHYSEGRGGTMLSCGEEQLAKRMEALLFPALRGLRLPAAECASLVLSASGIDSETLRRQYIAMLAGLGFPEDRIVAYNDCEMLLTLTDSPCITLIAGTGSIAMGKAAADGKIQRSGGWSYLLSDEGSAPYIALSAMRALIRHWDGRESCPSLARLAEERMDFCSAEAVVSFCHRHLQEKDRIASVAPLVEQAAQQGDGTAQRILLTAAEELSRLVESTARKLSLQDTPFRVLLWGSVLMRNQNIQRQVTARIRARYPLAEVFTLLTSAVDCAALLASGGVTDGMLRPVSLCREAEASA